MRGHPVEDFAENPSEKHDANPGYRVLYDGQCEICQACVSWLKTLDPKNKTTCLPISAEVLSAVDSRLKMDECCPITPMSQVEGNRRACDSCMSLLQKVKSMSAASPANSSLSLGS